MFKKLFKGRVTFRSPVRGLGSHISRRLLSGFIVLVPLLITVVILKFVFVFVDNFFRPLLVTWLGSGTPLDFAGIGVLITLILFYVTGAFFAGEKSRALQDAVLTKIPIVRNIYGVARQATEVIIAQEDQLFNRVVFVEWPRPGVKALGFVTGYYQKDKYNIGSRVAVYIPTVPNPTSGMLAFFEHDEIVETDISVQDAMKMVFSGGIVLPE